MKFAIKLGKVIKGLKLARKIQLLLLILTMPLMVLFCVLLISVNSYNRQYDKIIDNASEAARFSIDFKEDFDSKICLIIAGDSTFDLEKPYDMIDDARVITQNLIDNTSFEDNKKRVEIIKKLLDNLEKYTREIEQNKLAGGKHDENIEIWENGVQINTALIRSDVYEYSYYVTKEMDQVRQQLFYDLGRITLISAILFSMLVVVAIVLSFVIPNTIAKPILDLNNAASQVARLLHPIGSMIEVTKNLSVNDTNQLAEKNDEIGRLSASYNKMADTVFTLVNNLEEKVKERTQDLLSAKDALEENKNKLTIILNSTVEAIFGIDRNGSCTFCNTSCIKMLGYSDEEDLLGKSMHLLMRHSRKDGTPISEEDCNIRKTIQSGNGNQSEEEVFWRADGTSFDVAYYAYPQYKDGEIIGAVVTFTDNTERKRTGEHIKYLSCHDSLTGLFNRMYFEDSLKTMDIKKNLPISIIFCDLNGLKLTNDIFGHSVGDELIKKASKVLKKVCRDDDTLARLGGDEFIILLPHTEKAAAESIIRRVKTEFSKQKMVAIKCSISMGYDTKTTASDSIEVTMENAENNMYREKTNNRKAVSEDMLRAIVNTLHDKSPRESRHAISVSRMSSDLGKRLGLNETEIKRLEKAAYLHDIGKVVMCDGSDGVDNRNQFFSEDIKEIRQHAAVGFRVLNLFDETLDIASIVFNHHEMWDGKGYPKGLKSQEIPLLSRIISIAESYDRMVEERGMTQEEAINNILSQAGTKFDPQLAQEFSRMMKENKKN